MWNVLFSNSSFRRKFCRDNVKETDKELKKAKQKKSTNKLIEKHATAAGIIGEFVFSLSHQAVAQVIKNILKSLR